MKFSLLINMKMAAIAGIFSYLLAAKFSCSAMSVRKGFAIVSSLRFISRTNFKLGLVQHKKRFITSGRKLNKGKEKDQMELQQEYRLRMVKIQALGT